MVTRGDRARPAPPTAGRWRSAISTPGVVDRDSGRVTSLAYNVVARRRLRPARGDPRPRFDLPVLIDNNINLAARRREVVRAGARRLDDGVHRRSAPASGWGSSSTTSSCAAPTAPRARSATCRWSATRSIPRHQLHGGLEDEIGAAGRRSPRSRPGPRRRTAEVATAARRVRARRAPATAIARAVVEHIAARLGSAIATVCAILDPELVVLGGGIGSSPLLLQPRARRRRGAGPDHRADRDEPAGRPGRAAGRDRRRAARRAQRSSSPRAAAPARASCLRPRRLIR